MTRRFPVARHGQFQGEILLERALLGVGRERICTGTARCPRCGSGETVWPLSAWVPAVRPSTTAVPRAQPAVDAALPPRQQQKRPAAGTVMRY